jgi:hypothetical protein
MQWLIVYRVLNDMYYLCEKYAPLESLGKYDPQKDPSVTGEWLVGLDVSFQADV